MSDKILSVGPCFNTFEFGEGQPVVLIHGFPFDHTMWSEQINSLAATCKVIAPDLRGFGSSSLGDSAEIDSTEGVAMEAYAEDLEEILEGSQVTEPVILCGFSMGGYILWQFVQRFPERVKAIVLCDTRAVADSAQAAAGREQMATKVLSEGVEPLVQGMLPKLLAAKTQAERPELVEQVTAMMRKASPDAVAAALRGMASRPDVRGELSNFDWPALVVAGAEDAISTPEEMQTIAAGLPQAKFVEIADAGHMTSLENPAALNQALGDFIATL